MADLSSAYTEIRAQVSYELNYGMASPPATGTSAGDLIELCIKQGLRRAYWPGLVNLPGGPVVVDWNFLKLWARVDIHDDYSTGTVSVTNGSAVVTLATGTFPTWISDGYTEIVITDDDGDSDTYTILTRDGDDQVTLTANYAGDTDTGLSYIVRFGTATLPTDFGSIDGSIIIEGYSDPQKLQIVDAKSIYALVEANADTGWPLYAAVVPQAHAGASIQTQRLLVWPAFEGTIRMRYRVSPAMLDAGTPAVSYAYGGPFIHEVILESCMAVAEQRATGEPGLHTQAFQAALVAAVLADAQNEPDYYGRQKEYRAKSVLDRRVRPNMVEYDP